MPLQLAPAAHLALSRFFDLLMVLAAVAVFGAIAMAVTGGLPENAGTPALLLACVCWLIYRYVFFGRLSMTPGGHIAAAVADRWLAWMYNHRLQASGARL